MSARWIAAHLMAAFFLIAGSAWAQSIADNSNAPFKSQMLARFSLDQPGQTRFGKLEFVGGLVVQSSNPDFGGVSGMRISDQGLLTAVTDTGFWVRSRIMRNSDGVPSDWQDGHIARVLNQAGRPFPYSWQTDFEGLTFSANSAYLSAEVDTRVLRFSPRGQLLNRPAHRIKQDWQGLPLSRSFSFEGIATLPDDHAFAPGLVLLSEARPYDATNPPSYILRDDKLLQFSVERIDGFSVTDADFLPNGDLLLLERRSSLVGGFSLQVRRITGEEIKPGATLSGEILMKANSRHVIDNMEALSVFEGPNGETRIAMMSDNNHWPLQRNLYLEFILKN